MPRSRSSGALSIESKERNSPPCFSASTFVIAAVSVVFPWSTCPIVPTLTCGLSRTKVSLAMVVGVCSVRRGDSYWLASGSDRRALGLDDFLGDRLRHLGVVVERHRVDGAALRDRAQIGRVAEHL